MSEEIKLPSFQLRGVYKGGKVYVNLLDVRRYLEAAAVRIEDGATESDAPVVLRAIASMFGDCTLRTPTD